MNITYTGAPETRWFYVRRNQTGRTRSSWTGPLFSRDAAEYEAQAWNDRPELGWTATVEPATPAIEAEVSDWERAKTGMGPAVRTFTTTDRATRPVGPCPCECNSGGFCGGCGHAGCGGRR